MREYLGEILVIVEFIFLLPAIILGAIINIYKHFVLGKKVDVSEKAWGNTYYIFSLLAWFIIAGWIVYQSQFTTITYVFACPINNTSKCYRVRADYVPKDCADTEWDNRGAHGGQCTDPYIEKIYFENGGYINFGNCDMENKDKWTCYAENSDDGTWSLQISDTIRIKK
jgi:hypothetical protein